MGDLEESLNVSLVDNGSIYKQLLDLNPEAIIVHSDNKLVYANPAALKFYGVDQNFNYKDLHIYQLISPESIKEVNERIERININQINEQGIINVKTFDGNIKPVEINSQPIQFNNKAAILVIVRDLSEIVEAHQKVKSNEILFKTIFEAASNTILITDITDGKILEANKSIEELTGYKKDELVGKTTNEMGFWFNGNERDLLINQVKEIGRADNLELHFKVKSGRVIITKVNIRIIEIEGKKLLLTILEDITEVKKLDDEKNKLLKKLQESQKIAKIGNWTLDIKTNTLEWSDELFDIFEIDKNKFEPNYGYFLNAIHPNDRDYLNNIYSESIKKKSNYNCIHRLLLSHDRIKWIEETGHHDYDENGLHIYSYGTAQDITNSKMAEEKIRENEEKFRLIAENTHDVLMVIDDSFQLIYVSPSYRKQFKVDEKFKLPLSREQIFDMIHPEDQSIVLPKVFQALENRINNLQYIYRARYGNNEYMWREDNTSFVYDENNRFKIAYVVSRDITEKIKREEELKIAKEKAEESDKLKTAFLQNMSHEIRTPLNGILGFSRLLEAENLDKDEVKEFISLIKQSSYRLLETMNNILELSQIETGQVALQHKPIFINSLLSDLFDEYYDKAVQKHVKLSYKFGLDDESCYLQSDAKRLYQILSNLLSNAIKFTVEGEVEFGYFIDNFDMVFYVQDTGLGIKQEHIDMIFERFFQSELSISRNYEGNGLGLSICKELVKLLGGNIKVESEFGKGSKFYVSLPIS